MLETLEEIQRDGVADSGDALEDLRQELQENAEAVDSILLCANHQGRIADGSSSSHQMCSFASLLTLRRHLELLEDLDGTAFDTIPLARHHLKGQGGPPHVRRVGLYCVLRGCADPCVAPSLASASRR